MFKVNNENTKWRHWSSSGVFIVNFEHISHFFLVFLLLLWTSKCQLGKLLVYPFQANISFLSPLETSENQGLSFSHFSREMESECKPDID